MNEIEQKDRQTEQEARRNLERMFGTGDDTDSQKNDTPTVKKN